MATDIKETAIVVKDDEAEKKTAEEFPKISKSSSYFRIFTYGSTLDKCLNVFGTLTALAGGSALPLSSILFGNLVKKFALLGVPGSGYGGAQFRHDVNIQVLYFVYLFIAKFLLGYISALCFRISGIHISANIRLAYIRLLFLQNVSYFDILGPGTVAVRITSNANLIQNGISERLSILFLAVGLAGAGLVIAFIKSWELTLVTMCFIPAIFILYGIAVPINMKLDKEADVHYAKAADLAQEALSSIRTLLAFGAQHILGKKYDTYLEAAQKILVKQGPVQGLMYAGGFFGIYCANSLAFWYGARLYAHGKLSSPSVIITVLFCVMFVFFSVTLISPAVVALGQAATAASSIFELVDSTKKEGLDVEASGLKLDEIEGEIVFENVSFSYPSRKDVVVLNDLSMSFSRKEVTAIVGASGAGKSTIVGLLERWYDPNNGQISLDGQNLRDLNLKWLRGSIGFVQQEPFLFNDTIYNNICYGMIGSQWEHAPEADKRKRVEAVCEIANADVFIKWLPERYDTKVGEHGIKLSGGQKQRIAIARAIASDPSILILDEATSAIDVRSEALVQRALDEASKHRTTIVIAHRLSTIKRANKIIIMEKGTVVEQGTHRDLVAADGVYARMVRAQELNTVDTTAGQIAEKNEDSEITRDSDQAPESDEKVTYGDDGKKVKVKQPGLLRILSKFFYEQRRYAYLFVAILVACAAASAGWPLQAFLFSNVISVFEIVDIRNFVDRANFWALMYLMLALFSLVAYFGMGWVMSMQAQIFTRIYRLEYFRNMLAQEISFFDDEENSSGTLTARLSTDSKSLQELLGQNFGLTMTAFMSLVSCTVLALAVGWKLTLVGIISVMPITFTSAYVRVKMEVGFDKATAKVFASSAQFASEAISSIRTVSSLTLEDTVIQRYSDLLETHGRKAIKKSLWAMAVLSLSDSMDLLCSALTFWYGSRLLSTGEYTPKQYFLVYMAIVNGSQSSGQFLAIATNIAQGRNASQRIIDSRKRTFVDGTEELPISKDACEIDFEHVGFKYATRDYHVFENLNLKIKAGQFAAFVGASGSGKTTGISLLERFYDATSGQVLIDGKDITTLKREEYRKIVSLVSQEPTLYQGSLRDNILLGIDRDVSDDELHEVCRNAYIHEFIMTLPEGYATLCGTKGIGLSGGQKQRVAIARALIRSPRILLLDEATSALDSESEKIVQQAFESAATGRTMVVVAHRLSTIYKADIIFVFEDGKIVEQGNHTSLLRQQGRYFQMVEAQALNQ